LRFAGHNHEAAGGIRLGTAEFSNGINILAERHGAALNPAFDEAEGEAAATGSRNQ
jgi:hypothetical protein